MPPDWPMSVSSYLVRVIMSLGALHGIVLQWLYEVLDPDPREAGCISSQSMSRPRCCNKSAKSAFVDASRWCRCVIQILVFVMSRSEKVNKKLGVARRCFYAVADAWSNACPPMYSNTVLQRNVLTLSRSRFCSQMKNIFWSSTKPLIVKGLIHGLAHI